MDIGFDTIGNATLICYDNGPVLTTDPWIEGNPYFGSWALAYEVPEEQTQAIKQCQYVWISHGHPDHLDIKSLNLLKDKKILLADHVGGRIATDLGKMGFDVTVLSDRKWTNLSPRINVLSLTDYNQDSILLVDIDGTLVLDLNDATPRGWLGFVKRIAKKYDDTFLLEIFGYGDADMINYIDEEGVRVEPRAALRLPVGATVAQAVDAYGVKYVIPFSSLHKYQRADSVWANQYLTELEDYKIGFNAKKGELLPAFVRYDCANKSLVEIEPQKAPDTIVDSKEFRDDWSETLEAKDVEKVGRYFKAISHLGQVIDFVNVKVGGEDNIVQLKEGKFDNGVVFEVPKHSLMRAIRYEIFDDLLIGNFMRTHLVGKWPKSKLYPDFSPYVAKYADNGLAKTPEQLRQYFSEYRRRAPLEYILNDAQTRLASVFRTRVDSRSGIYQVARKAWWFVNKRITA